MTKRVCAECGQALPEGVRPESCPSCLLSLGILEAAGLAGVAEDGLEDASLPGEQPGARIGRYVLREQIGEGGFGAVWRAEQTDPVRRQVALKLIKLGMDTKEVVARFEAERQALAMMDHASIARVFDGGATEAGRPYFVMELVPGERITDYCDAHRLGLEARLQLFIEVCQAVHHAHQKGIIHRDLKPSNVLVTEQGGRAVPKVIDFGIAKATGVQLTAKTLFTRSNQFIGTPAYMSPEQAGLGALDIDTRSDVYALGVLLYELLTGNTPFSRTELLQAGWDEVLQRLREQEPPRPSTRLSALTREELALVALHRGSAPEPLRRRLRGELDWTVMKALEKDRTRRYESAAALAADIDRFLRQESVSAAPPTVGYRVGKFARRHRVALVTTAAFVIVLMAGAAVSVRQAVRATRHARAERREATNAIAARLESERHRRQADQNFAITRENLYAADVFLAQRALREGRLGAARAALEAHRPRGQTTNGSPDPRGFEWRYFWAQCQGEQLAILRGHSNAVTSLAFSTDGRTLLSAGADRTMRFWDVAKRQLVETLPTGSNVVTTAAFSWSGDSVVGACAEGGGKVWRRSTGKPEFTFNLPPGDIAFAPSLTRLAVSPYQEGGDRIRIYSLTNYGQPERTLTNALGRAAFAHDGLRVAVAGPAEIGIWVISDKRLVRSFANSNQVDSLRFSPDDRRLAGYGREGHAIQLWDVESSAWLGSLHGHAGRILDAAFSPDGRLLVTAGADGSVRVWDVTALREHAHWRGHESEVRAIAFSPDGHGLASAGKDQTIRFWSTKPRPPVSEITNAYPPFLLSPDGRRLVAQVAESPRDDVTTMPWAKPFELYPDGHWGSVPAPVSRRRRVAGVLWDLPTGVAGEPFLLSPYTTAFFGPDGGTLRVVSRHMPQGALCVRSATELEDACVDFADSRATHLGTVASVDGHTVVVVTTAGRVQLYEAGTGTRLAELGLTDPRQPMVRLSPDGQNVACSAAVAGAEIWNVPDRTRRCRLEGLDRPLNGFAFSPDGQSVATAGVDNDIGLWDVRTGAARGRFTGHREAVLQVAFSADGRTLASSSADGTVKLWSLPARREVATLEAGTGLTFLAFAADDRVLLGGNRLGRLHRWQAPTLREIDTDSLAAESPPRPEPNRAFPAPRPSDN